MSKGSIQARRDMAAATAKRPSCSTPKDGPRGCPNPTEKDKVYYEAACACMDISAKRAIANPVDGIIAINPVDGKRDELEYAKKHGLDVKLLRKEIKRILRVTGF